MKSSMKSFARKIFARKNFTRITAILAVLIIASSTLSAAALFDKSEYAARRQKFMEKIPDGVAVIFGAQPIASYYPYAQANDFLYLTGVELPNAALIIDGARKSCHPLLHQHRSRRPGRGHRRRLGQESRRTSPGSSGSCPIESLTAMLAGLASRAKVLYTPFRPEELYREASTEKFTTLQRNMTLNPWDGRLTRELQFVKVLKDRFPQLEVRDCSPLIWELRTIKSPAEIALLRKAARIGVKAHTAIMQGHPARDVRIRALGHAQLCLREGRRPGKRLRRHHLLGR